MNGSVEPFIVVLLLNSIKAWIPILSPKSPADPAVQSLHLYRSSADWSCLCRPRPLVFNGSTQMGCCKSRSAAGTRGAGCDGWHGYSAANFTPVPYHFLFRLTSGVLQELGILLSKQPQSFSLGSSSSSRPVESVFCLRTVFGLRKRDKSLLFSLGIADHTCLDSLKMLLDRASIVCCMLHCWLRSNLCQTEWVWGTSDRVMSVWWIVAPLCKLK